MNNITTFGKEHVQFHVQKNYYSSSTVHAAIHILKMFYIGQFNSTFQVAKATGLICWVRGI